MNENARHSSEERAVDRIRHQATSSDVGALVADLRQGDRAALSRSITWLESTVTSHRDTASAILRKCLPFSGQSLRIGITGVPGVGKSTFIDALGDHLVGLGKKVAVLAVDPSSRVSGGSILGDKTRMEKLSMNPHAFIRPSPSANALGGVARKTRETIVLCEAAGYDLIIVETVGVGQSETAVHGMTDFFLLLMLAGAGDQLQGIKRGIMEMCDAMLITKADGDNDAAARRAMGEYMSALHLFPPKESGWMPQVATCSAIEHRGIAESWEIILQHERWMKERNLFDENRRRQDEEWLLETIAQRIREDFFSQPANVSRMQEATKRMNEKELTPFEAADWVLNKKSSENL